MLIFDFQIILLKQIFGDRYKRFLSIIVPNIISEKFKILFEQ